jgi:hypothetical protein
MVKREWIPQKVADALLALEKRCANPNTVWEYPRQGETLHIPLISADGTEKFTLDVAEHKIVLSKQKMQTRARKTIVLARLEINGAPHTNPNGERISGSHLHIYKEGYDDKFAIPLSETVFKSASTLSDYLYIFEDFCKIIDKPNIQLGVFP